MLWCCSNTCCDCTLSLSSCQQLGQHEHSVHQWQLALPALARQQAACSAAPALRDCNSSGNILQATQHLLTKHGCSPSMSSFSPFLPNDPTTSTSMCSCSLSSVRASQVLWPGPFSLLYQTQSTCRVVSSTSPC